MWREQGQRGVWRVKVGVFRGVTFARRKSCAPQEKPCAPQEKPCGPQGFSFALVSEFFYTFVLFACAQTGGPGPETTNSQLWEIYAHCFSRSTESSPRALVLASEGTSNRRFFKMDFYTRPCPPHCADAEGGKTTVWPKLNGRTDQAAQAFFFSALRRARDMICQFRHVMC